MWQMSGKSTRLRKCGESRGVENPFGSGSSNRGESIPVGGGFQRGQRSLCNALSAAFSGCALHAACGRCGRKNPKKPAVSWHTILLARSSVLYLCDAAGGKGGSRLPQADIFSERRAGGPSGPYPAIFQKPPARQRSARPPLRGGSHRTGWSKKVMDEQRAFCEGMTFLIRRHKGI